MYRCYNPKKIKYLLLLDTMFVIIYLIASSISRSIHSVGSFQTQEGVFLPIVMYHSITDTANSDYQITKEQFAQDLYYLYANGYETVSVGDLLAYTEGKGELPEKPVMLTFDDGFYNNLSIALPLLEEYNMCAVVSIVGYYTDETAEKDPHVDSYSYLTWEDIKLLQKSGKIEIGSHTYNLHSNNERAGCSIMYGEDSENYQNMLYQDLNQLQTRAKEQTGFAPVAFAYPYGFICKESIPVLKKLGFVCTFSCREQGNYITHDAECLYGLDRYNRSPDYSTEEFFSKILNNQ
ncbi:MAG: polysaccharide deacetylase family protein [Oscillospiraceae bacterium]|nr:polysaccharide deacetylase family protein [Oscillospiraceae bacterium]